MCQNHSFQTTHNERNLGEKLIVAAVLRTELTSAKPGSTSLTYE